VRVVLAGAREVDTADAINDAALFDGGVVNGSGVAAFLQIGRVALTQFRLKINDSIVDEELVLQDRVELVSDAAEGFGSRAVGMSRGACHCNGEARAAAWASADEC
jgi:hypothetical protein